MKLLIWSVFALLALLWTGGAWLTGLLVQAVSGALAAGGGVDWAQAVQAWQVPVWLAPWVDGQFVQLAQGAIGIALEWLGGAGPHVATVVGWLVPLVWIGWGLGFVLLLVLAGALHWLVGRGGPGGPTRGAGAPAARPV